MTRFNCPNCGSDQTRSLPMIHASGTSNVRLTSIYVDTDDDVGVIPSYGKSQTAAVKMAAPPRKKEPVTGGFVGWILVVLRKNSIWLPPSESNIVTLRSDV